MDLKKYRILLNIFYFFIITYELLSYKNSVYVEGECYHQDIVSIMYLDYDTYYIYNCTFKKHNYSNVCFSHRYLEKESKCYICDIKENYILVQKYTCDFEELIHKIFFYIFLVLIINLVCVVLKKNETVIPKKNIKILSYNKSDLLINNNQENNICSICLTNFEDKYNFVIKTNCVPVNHFFCYSCSKKWFVDNNNVNCPNCRQIILEFL
jgi:hypothetical protein